MPPTRAPQLERKTLHTSVKVLDNAAGIVEMYVAATGNRDDGGDVIEPGAMSEWLKTYNPKGIHAHDWGQFTSKTIEAEEVPPGDPRLPEKMRAAGVGGLRIKSQYNLETQVGRETFSNVKFLGPEQEWSIGYIADPAATRVDDKTGTRFLGKIAVYEYSDVLVGMNALTATVSTKVSDGKKAYVPSPDGSFERRAELIQEAVQRAEGDTYWVCVVATFDNTIVYYLYANMGGETGEEDQAYQRTYNIAADGTVTLGERADVDVEMQIMPAKDGARGEQKVSEASWDGSSSRFTDAEWKKACAACEGKSDAPKTDCYLPHHEPGGEVSRAGVHAAAARFNQTTRDNSDKAKSHLASHYKNDLSEDVPAVLGGSKQAVIDEPCATCADKAAAASVGDQKSDEEAAADAIDLAAKLLTKEGRVLSGAHYDKLQAARDNIDTVMAAHADAMTSRSKSAEDGKAVLTLKDLAEYQRVSLI